MFHFQGIEKLSKLASLMYHWMINILIVTHTPRDRVGSRNRMNYKIFHFQGIERLMLNKLASLMYLWMKDILMVTHTPRDGVEKQDLMF